MSDEPTPEEIDEDIRKMTEATAPILAHWATANDVDLSTPRSKVKTRAREIKKLVVAMYVKGMEDAIATLQGDIEDRKEFAAKAYTKGYEDARKELSA